MFRPHLCDTLPTPVRRTCYSLAMMPGSYFALRVTCVAAVLLIIAAGCESDRPKANTAQADKKVAAGGAELASARDSEQRANQVNADKLKLVAAITGPMP